MKSLLCATLAGLLLATTFVSAAQAELRLLMIEEDGCIYCQRWQQDVGQEFPITPEGRAAPLWRIDIRSDEIDQFDLVSRPRLTPTFILVENKVELSRLEGYPGEDFFWGLLGQMLERSGVNLYHLEQQ